MLVADDILQLKRRIKAADDDDDAGAYSVISESTAGGGKCTTDVLDGVYSVYTERRDRHRDDTRERADTWRRE